LAIIIEVIAEVYNAVLLIKGIGIKQTISFLTTNCVKSRPGGERINAMKAKLKGASGKKKCDHCSWIGHTTECCWDLHPELCPKQENALMVQHDGYLPIM
jgi:hypothetical protein